jgi:hypothetical protein
MTWPSAWSGTVLPDGLAALAGVEPRSVVVAQRASDGVWLRTFSLASSSYLVQSQSARLAAEPEGGVLALWPFAYYAAAGSVRHVAVDSGLLETMADVGPGARPLTVVNR